MNVLVTGGAGYIGSHVNLALRDAGLSTVVHDNLSAGFREAVSDTPLVVADLADLDALDDTLSRHRIDAIIHLAAKVVVEESVRDPVSYFYSNTVNTLNLLKLAVKHRITKLVFSSTAAVYGDPDGDKVDENVPPLPTNPYGMSKLLAENMIREVCAAHGVSFVILRYFNVAGADPAGRVGQSTRGTTHLVKAACEAMTGKRRELVIFGDDYGTPDGTCVRDYIHVSDLAAAHLAALRHIERQPARLTLNCGYGRGFSVREVVSVLESVAGQPLEVRIGPRRAGDVPCLVADNRRIQATLDWQPQYDRIEDIVAHALQWERAGRY